MTMVAAAQTTAPWHGQLFHAFSCSGIDGSSVDDSTQQGWWQSTRWCLGTIVGHPLPSPMMAKRSATRTKVCNNDSSSGADSGALALSCSLLARVTALIAAVHMTVRKNNGSRQKMVPCWHCRPSLACSRNSNNSGSTAKWRQSRQRCLIIVGHPLPSSMAATAVQTTSATTKVVAVWTKVPWHCWAFLAITHDRDNCSSVSYDAQQ
jgi:hypothetical protein